MDNDQKSENLVKGFRPKSFIKPTGILPRTAAKKLSLRPTRSVSSVKSIKPAKVAPLGIIGNKEEEV